MFLLCAFLLSRNTSLLQLSLSPRSCEPNLLALLVIVATFLYDPTVLFVRQSIVLQCREMSIAKVLLNDNIDSGGFYETCG